MQLSKKFKASKFINDKRVLYVIINIGLGFIGFVKAFVFMTYFDFKELGIITLINTSIMFVSLLQFGLLNGGYRLYSIGNKEEIDDVNDTINSYFLILTIIILFIAIFSYFSDFKINFLYLIVGGFTGVATLSQNWLSNILIAKSQLKKLNFLNTVKAVATIFLILAVPFYDFLGALLVIIIPPFLFAIMAFMSLKELRPKTFSFKLPNLKLILISGFIPFLTGIFDQINIQIHNWSIQGVLSEEFLGKFYLVSLYTMIFMLIPKSINSLFFPKAMRLYNQNKFIELRNHLKKYYIYLIIYITPVIIITLTLMKPVISLVLPNHLIGVNYVFLIIPGLVFLLLAAPIALIYNASLKLRPMLYAYSLSSIINLLVIFILWKKMIFNLTNIAILKSVLGIFIFLYFYFSYFINSDKIWNKANAQ